ncbi:unnamed protein product, partial [Mesorhabditis belari]|uniref:Uncharacterized protein n=1 Tax=Mesorhabditis belari TaxID=2138241 RepID=A0AAF3FA48_9BILA
MIGDVISATKKGLPCRIVVFNADDETMIGDVISATKTVFANSRKRQTRKGMDFPDDLADSVADEGSATNEIDRGESLTVEEMSHLKATERWIQSSSVAEEAISSTSTNNGNEYTKSNHTAVKSRFLLGNVRLISKNACTYDRLACQTTPRRNDALRPGGHSLFTLLL